MTTTGHGGNTPSAMCWHCAASYGDVSDLQESNLALIIDAMTKLPYTLPINTNTVCSVCCWVKMRNYIVYTKKCLEKYKA